MVLLLIMNVINANWIDILAVVTELTCYKYFGTGTSYLSETEHSKSKFTLCLQVYVVWCENQVCDSNVKIQDSEVTRLRGDLDIYKNVMRRAYTSNNLSQDCLKPKQLSQEIHHW